MNIFGVDNTLDLIIICLTVVAILQIIFNFLKWLLKDEEDYVEELLSEEKYFNDDNVPCFKRLYKRTYNSGKIELISTED